MSQNRYLTSSGLTDSLESCNPDESFVLPSGLPPSLQTEIRQCVENDRQLIAAKKSIRDQNTLLSQSTENLRLAKRTHLAFIRKNRSQNLFNSFSSFSHRLHESGPPALWICLTTIGFILLGLSISLLLSAHQFGTFVVTVLFALLGAIATHLFLIKTRDLPFPPIVIDYSADLQATRKNVDFAAIRLNEVRQEFLKRETHFVQLRNALVQKTTAEVLSRYQEHSIRLLLKRDWRRMSSIEFEQYLADLFKALDFQVEETSVTGDQGVDLVVERDGVRSAVQAKGYPSGSSIGNEVILKTKGGAHYYNCKSCIVITNSRFTRSALKAANSIGVVLVSEENFEAWFESQVRSRIPK